MLPIDDRISKHDAWAMVAFENIDVIADRIMRMVSTGRRMTKVGRYLNSDSLDVRSGLHLDPEAPHGGLHLTRQANPVGAHLNVLCQNVASWSIGAYEHDGTEEQIARRYHNGDRIDMTTIRIEGFGEGLNDKIEYTYYNQHGVGRHTVIAFDYISHSQQAEAEAQVVDTLAAQADREDGALSAARLREIAHSTRYWREPVADALAYEAGDPSARTSALRSLNAHA